MLTVKKQCGFSLVELMIAIVILGILISLGLPNFKDWINNTKLRNAAESSLNGLQLGRAEAVRRNMPIALVITDTAPLAANVNTLVPSSTGKNWVLRVFQSGGVYTTADFIQGAQMAESAVVSPIQVQRIDAAGNPMASGTSSAEVDTIVFNGLGRMPSVLNTGATVTNFVKVRLDFTYPAGGACVANGGPMRCLAILLSAGGQIKMCDPAVLTAGDTRKC